MEFPMVGFKNGGSSHHSESHTPDSFPHGRLCFEEDGNAISPLNRDLSNLEEHEILTSSGIHQRVYVQRSNCKRALITYHDIGTNHVSFLGFFNHPEMRVIRRHFTVYHICAPGHHENASNELFDVRRYISRVSRRLMSDPANVSQDQFRLIDEKDTCHRVTDSHAAAVTPSSPSTKTIANYPSLDNLAEMLTSILVHFGIDSFIGFGMGAGSNILARYALHHPNSVLGLFLLNPTCTAHSTLHRMIFNWWDSSSLLQGHLTDRLFDQLNNHWFGYGLPDDGDVVNFYRELARSLNPVNMAGYMRTFMDRTDLNLVRPQGPAMPGEAESSTDAAPTVIKAEVCLVTGDMATDLANNVAEMNGRMDPKCTQFILIPDCTGMVMEENPDALATDFLHFLRSIGYLINLTPTKLHQEAVQLQLNQQAVCSFDVEDKPIPAQLHVTNEA